MEGFASYNSGGIIFGGVFTWRGFYMEGFIFGILQYLSTRARS